MLGAVGRFYMWQNGTANMAVSQMNGKASICANSAEPQENGRRGANRMKYTWLRVNFAL